MCEEGVSNCPGVTGTPVILCSCALVVRNGKPGEPALQDSSQENVSPGCRGTRVRGFDVCSMGV